MNTPVKAVTKPRRTSATARRPTVARKARRGTLERADWVAAAREIFVAGGVAAVKIGQVSARLGVTREAFYWHFRSLQELHDELLADWERDNTSRFEPGLRGQWNPAADLPLVENLLMGDETFRAAWDTAMRDWGRVSKQAARVVARIDEQRTEMLNRAFVELGYGEVEAMARARVYYLFQVGYYMTQVKDWRELRRRLMPEYLRILLGEAPPRDRTGPAR
jgi:AcrR family transcriptional regulator